MNDEERLFWESGYYHARRDIWKELGWPNTDVELIGFLKSMIERASAWQLLDEVIDHSVSLPVAVNKLQREIEKARGI